MGNIAGLNVTEEQYKAQLREYLYKNAALKPYDHQIDGVFFLLKNPYTLVADEMGVGKTKQVIDAAQCMFMQGGIDRVLIVCPGSIRSVWFDPELGEWAKHVWPGFPLQVAEYRNKVRIWKTTEDADRLKVVVTNYEYLRNDDRLAKLGPVLGPRTLLVVEESSFIANFKAQQSRAIRRLRKNCGRVILLNGTPITEGMGQIYSQAYVMSPKILGYKTKKAFDSAHRIKTGWMGKSSEWKNVEYIQRRMAPYVIRRLKEDCLDLPKKIPPVLITVQLDKGTWAKYKQMEEEFIAWLQDNEASESTHAAVRAIRLQQITSGFLGGIKAQPFDENGEIVEGAADYVLPTQRIGFEKEKATIAWMRDRIAEDPEFKCVIWGRFTLEVSGLIEAFNRELPEVVTGRIAGGQKEDERNFAKRLLDPRSAPKDPVAVIGNPASGGMGLTLVAAYSMVYTSNYWRLITRLQADDRIHRPGQVKPCSYFDMVAIGPDGQKTIDFRIIKRLRNKQSVAEMTSAAWLTELRES